MTAEGSGGSADSFLARIRHNLNDGVPAAVRMRCLDELISADGADRGVLERLLVDTLRHDPNPVVRHEAAFVLGRLFTMVEEDSTGSLALAALCESSHLDPSVIVRHEAAESLGGFHHPRAWAALWALVADPEPDIAITARVGLEHHALRGNA